MKYHRDRCDLYGNCTEVCSSSIYIPCSSQPQKGPAEITCIFTSGVTSTGTSRGQPWLQNQVGEEPSPGMVLMAPRTAACGSVLPNAPAGEAVCRGGFPAEPAGGDDAEPGELAASGDSPEPVLFPVLEGSAASYGRGCVTFCL